MRFHKTLIVSLLSLVASSTAEVLFTDDVPLAGPVLSANFDPSNSTAIKNAKAQFPTVIGDLFRGGLLNRTDLVFHVDVFSAATNKSIYNYLHIGERQNKTLTSGRVDEDTIFRIGSISKLFTVYALLAKAGINVMSHPVTKYLPELATNASDPLENLNWGEITLGALASHLAGTGAAPYLYTNYAPKFSNIPVEEILKQARNKRPTISAYRTSMYPDAGFVLLGQIISRIGGKPYAEVVKDAISTPLGLQSTATKAPTDPNVNGVHRYPVDKNPLWGYDVASVAPSGGYYSSASDLRKLGLSIFSSQILSAAATQS